MLRSEPGGSANFLSARYSDSRVFVDDQETLITKKRGPKPTGVGTLIGVRLLPGVLKPLDAWIERHPEPKPSRPEAIRQLIRKALEAE